jgi:hypothetical protein
MPIRSLLSETSFNSDQTEMIAKAFDDAWAELQGGQAEPAMSSLVRTALAKRIIEMAQRDGMTAKKLRDDAIAHIKNDPLWPAL